VGLILVGAAAGLLRAQTGADAPPEALQRATTASDMRRQAIPDLVGFLDNERVFADQPEIAAQAVFLVGELRAEETTPILLEHLDFMGNRPLGGDSLQDFPCALALTKIGAPAAREVVKLMAADDDAWWLGLQILYRIDGSAVTAARLTVAAERQTDRARAQRLRKAAGSARAYGKNHPSTRD